MNLMNSPYHHHPGHNHYPACAPVSCYTPPACAPVSCYTPPAGAPSVSTVDSGGVSYIKDPANHRQIEVVSNGPGVDVAVYDTSTNPRTLDMRSWGDPHDVSRNGVTTDSHGARTFRFEDGSTLNLGTRNADNTEPRPGQGGAATFNASAVYIPGNNPNTAAVVTHQPGQAPQSTTVQGSVGYIQGFNKDPAQLINVCRDGNFRTATGQPLTPATQLAEDVITGGPPALRLAAATSMGLRGQAGSQAWHNNMMFQQSMHTSMMCQLANRFYNGGGNCNSLNFLYTDPEYGGYYQHRLVMAPTQYERQRQAEQIHRYLMNMGAGPSRPSYDHHFGYSGYGWRPPFSGFCGTAGGWEWR